MSDDGYPSYPKARSSKRDNHNYLERNRRDNMKKSFDRLRHELPSFKAGRGGKRNPSRIQVLKQAADFMNECKKAGVADSQAIDKMRAEQAEMEAMIAKISAATASGDFDAAKPLVNKHLLTQKAEQSLSEVEEDDAEELEDGEEEDEETTDSDDSEENDSDQADFIDL